MIFKPNPSLIFIHLPKAAGSSLSKVLDSNYENSTYWINSLREKHKINNGHSFRVLKPGIKAMYGHIYAHPNLPEIFPNSQFITWLRDPVERAQSLYCFWQVLGAEGRVDATDIPLQTFAEEQPSFDEFVQNELYAPQIKGYTSYLGGLKPEQYAFAGRQSHFESDLARCGKILGWKNSQGVKTNVNPKKSEISSNQKEELKELLSEEYAIYQSFLDYFHEGKP